ncbi:unnamed protein product [Chondrus crispus]|uniref:Orn/DAP/Arg decarboxylase 2 N-terminal domain-containing protein n=1 Tax=Chondrus crispus TaxID=2769 RepID=R7QCH2_CHOCR|nr:unnamed protein product [Chondrus crispus]CDF35774.1 unnamed protein product [Chondrus crispus]|eukprot:XP_005715593.1 unnamed protein product [Chondrus crispus]
MTPATTSPTPTPAQARISTTLQAALRTSLLSADAPVALFYDLARLSATCRELVAAFPPSALHAFALKAAPFPRLLRHLHASGLGAECASIAELGLAAAADIPPARVIYDSPAKTDAHLVAALSAGVHVNADSFAELARIAELMPLHAPRPAASVGLRVNPQLGSASIAETFTAAAACKFGEPLREARADILAAYAKFPFLDTVHVHVGSQGCGIDTLVAGAREAVALADEVNRGVAGRVRQIDIGGGLSVDYWSDGEGSSFAEMGDRLRGEVPGLAKYRVVTEFGRRVASAAGFVAARVQAVKRSGGRTYVVCHAGADLLVRPVYQGDKWGHRVEVYDAAGRLKGGETETVDVAGPICFAGDVIARDRELARAQEGDWIVVRDAGAYTLSMYCRHTSQLTPPVYGVGEAGVVTTICRGETVEDVVRFWGGGGGGGK